jgi:hypothetical protein
MRASRTGIAVSAFPGLLALGLFYSLAFHMHRALGRWPDGIGEAGFPSSLTTHAYIATTYFWIAILISVFTVPLAIVACLVIPQWRRFVPYFALYAFVFVASILLMQLAPAQFLYWWND